MIVGPAWIGDMVMVHSLVRVLADRYPSAQIDIAAPAWSGTLVARMPEVRRAIDIPFKHGQFLPIARWMWGKTLRDIRYDWVIVLPYTWKAALLIAAAKIPKRTGYVGEQRWLLLNDIRKLDKIKLPMMVQRYVALGLDEYDPIPEQIPLPRLTIDIENQNRALSRLQISVQDRPLMVICPGAEYGPAKRWPARYFAETAKAKIAEGWQVWIIGGAKEYEIGQEIIEVVGDQCINLAGKTNLQEAIDLIALATAVVTNDSGLMHIAASVGVPIYAIFGSSAPNFTPPLSNRAKIISLQLECSPCFKKQCPLGHYDCLKKLLPERVIQEIKFPAEDK